MNRPTLAEFAHEKLRRWISNHACKAQCQSVIEKEVDLCLLLTNT